MRSGSVNPSICLRGQLDDLRVHIFLDLALCAKGSPDSGLSKGHVKSREAIGDVIILSLRGEEQERNGGIGVVAVISKADSV